MHLLEKLSKPFLKHSENEALNYSKLFKLGDEISKLERKRKKLYESLGDEVYHQRLENILGLNKEIQLIDQEILKKYSEMEKLSDKR